MPVSSVTNARLEVSEDSAHLPMLEQSASYETTDLHLPPSCLRPRRLRDTPTRAERTDRARVLLMRIMVVRKLTVHIPASGELRLVVL